jgi:hypothetical protein
MQRYIYRIAGKLGCVLAAKSLQPPVLAFSPHQIPRNDLSIEPYKNLLLLTKCLHGCQSRVELNGYEDAWHLLPTCSARLVHVTTWMADSQEQQECQLRHPHFFYPSQPCTDPALASHNPPPPLRPMFRPQAPAIHVAVPLRQKRATREVCPARHSSTLAFA